MKWDDFVKWSNLSNLWESNIEEHNRYLRPPRGTGVLKWALMLLKLKYEFRPHKPTDPSEYEE